VRHRRCVLARTRRWLPERVPARSDRAFGERDLRPSANAAQEVAHLAVDPKVSPHRLCRLEAERDAE